MLHFVAGVRSLNVSPHWNSLSSQHISYSHVEHKYELTWNGACSTGSALCGIQKGVASTQWWWQWLLACSGPWHSRPITISEKTQTIPSLLEEHDAICSQVWLIPAEQSQPHHMNECRQEITKGARLSLFHTTSCFHNQIIPSFFFLWVCVLPKCCFSGLLSQCNGTLQGPFPLTVRSESFFCLWSQSGLQRKKIWRPVSR